jgi:hypothetical protein
MSNSGAREGPNVCVISMISSFVGLYSLPDESQ